MPLRIAFAVFTLSWMLHPAFLLSCQTTLHRPESHSRYDGAEAAGSYHNWDKRADPERLQYRYAAQRTDD